MGESRYDFHLLKKRVSVPMVLERYGVMLKREGNHLRGQCLLQNGTGHGKTGFIAWDNGWMCHSCDKKGNVIDLVAAKERVDPTEAVKLLYEWFTVGAGVVRIHSRPTASPTTGPQNDTAPANAPIRFRLDVDPAHPFGKQRGFEIGHCEYLGCGHFAGDGALSNRWVFPVHDAAGELVGYAGRLVEDSAITDGNPRWRFTKGFRKSLELYNLHRVVRGGFSDILVVESFWGVLACVRAGIMNAVALMGRTISEKQAELLTPFPNVTLLMDGDKPGREASWQVGCRLLDLPDARSVRVLFLPAGLQPDNLEPSELQQLAC